MTRRPEAPDALDDTIRCTECECAVDEFSAIAKHWGFWSDGTGELLPFCPECARREFAPDAPALGREDDASPPRSHWR